MGNIVVVKRKICEHRECHGQHCYQSNQSEATTNYFESQYISKASNEMSKVKLKTMVRRSIHQFHSSTMS